MGALKRFRTWRAKRRIDRIIRDCGWPVNPELFSGSIIVTDVRYKDGKFAIERLGEGEWPL